MKMLRYTHAMSLLLCFLCFHLYSYPPLPYEELFIPHPDNIEQETHSELALGCVFRNEASWLKEWIEYHLLIGVEHFYLYNNCSTDNCLEVLTPYIKNGTVELFDFPKTNWTNLDQNYMYNHTLALAQPTTKWLAIIDTDEFINPHTSIDLKDYLKNHKNAASIYIKWQMFGTSGVVNLEPGQLMIEELVFRAPDGDQVGEAWGKSIYQTKLTTSIDSPHRGSHPRGTYIHYPSTNEIKVNHYTFRTEEFLYKVKLARLKIMAGGHIFGSSAAILKYLPLANTTRDDTIARYIEPLRKRCFELDSSYED